MDRESYSIDDILSEVKRRRAEEENKNSNFKNNSDSDVIFEDNDGTIVSTGKGVVMSLSLTTEPKRRL